MCHLSPYVFLFVLLNFIFELYIFSRSFQRRRSSAKAFQKELDDIKKVNEAATKIQAVFRGWVIQIETRPETNKPDMTYFLEIF